MKSVEKKNKMKRTIKHIIVVLLISTMFISSAYIYKNNSTDKQEKNKLEELAKKVETKMEQVNNKSDEVDIEKLIKINSDSIAWLKIEGSNINYPVMQTKDMPNYYLKRNFYKEYSNMGTPYISEYCDIETSDNIIIYGHNIKGRKMFGELENYKKQEYYNNHKTITLYTKNKKTNYEIIAVFKTIASIDFEYNKFYKAESKEEYDNFIKKCKQLSFYNIKKEVNYGKKLITLSTCEYSNKNGRLIVVAVEQ